MERVIIKHEEKGKYENGQVIFINKKKDGGAGLINT